MTYRKQAADGWPFYQVFRRVDVTTPEHYYVAETWMSIDGPRSRIVRGGFHTLEAAQLWIEEHQNRGGTR